MLTETAATEARLRSKVTAAQREAEAAAEEARQALASARGLEDRIQQSLATLLKSEAHASTLRIELQEKCEELQQVQQVMAENEARLRAAKTAYEQARSPKSAGSPTKREIELKVSSTGQPEAPLSTPERQLAAVPQEICDLQPLDAAKSPQREIEPKSSPKKNNGIIFEDNRKSASRRLLEVDEEDRESRVFECVRLQDALHEKTEAASLLLEAGVELSEGLLVMCTELKAILSSISDETLDAQGAHLQKYSLQ